MRAQLLACAIPQIDAIRFTHAHADHVLGIDDIRILNRIVKRPIDAFAETRTIAELDRRFDYAFKDWTSQPHFFRPVLVKHPIAFGDTVETCGLQIRTFEQDHGLLSTIGLRVNGFAYSTDVVTLNEHAVATLEGVDTWVVDCFQRGRHTTHANVDQVITWFEQLRPRRMILTHMGYDIDWAWLQRRMPAGIEPGFDGMLIESR
jgi:phosphoribosyl 1,2-cyclic phosphate phosphodiesterase